MNVRPQSGMLPLPLCGVSAALLSDRVCCATAVAGHLVEFLQSSAADLSMQAVLCTQEEVTVLLVVFCVCAYDVCILCVNPGACN